jgi:hypothetical protein
MRMEMTVQSFDCHTTGWTPTVLSAVPVARRVHRLANIGVAAGNDLRAVYVTQRIANGGIVCTVTGGKAAPGSELVWAVLTRVAIP